MKKIPHGDENLVCPFHQKAMSNVCHKCPLWTQIRGKDPQTMAEIDDWNCGLAWLPILMVETAQQVRQGAAATESFRNVFHEAVATAAAVKRPVLTAPLGGPLLLTGDDDAI